jgi:phage antirepressor YoqD-like protein
VDFHGQALVVVDKEGEPYVVMRPIVEGMGLDWASQFTKLTEDTRRWGTVVIRATVAADGKTREMTCLPLRKLAGWLMTLQPNRMDMFVADKVRIYQNECDDALWAYWTKGVAVNPRAHVAADPTEMGLPNFRNPRQAAVAWIEQLDRAEAAEAAALRAQSTVRQLAAKMEDDAPKVDFADRLQAAPTTHLVGAVAKMIQQGTKISMGQNRMFEWLRENKYLHQTGSRRNHPTQRSLDAGWFTLQVRNVEVNSETKVKYTTRVTGKGLLHLYEHFYAMAVESGLKPDPTPPMVTSADILRQLPLWEHEDRDGVDERLVAEARRMDRKDEN